MSIEHLLGKVHNVDCLEFMRQLPDKCVDLVLTDPPYDEATHKGAITGADKTLGISFKKIENYNFISNLVRVSRSWVIVFMPVESLGLVKNQFPDFYIRGGIWDRICNTPQISGDRPGQAVEGIAILHDKGKKVWNGGGKAGIWRDMVERGTKEHETQKPIGLNVLLVEDLTNPGQIAFDTLSLCMGQEF